LHRAADRTNALATLAEWRHYISLTTTWLIQGSKAIFLFFVGYLWYQYGDIHLGNKNDKPEFPTVTYASMILTAGAGNGLLVYSVFEPLLNRKFHYYANAGYRSQDEIDIFAINMTVVGWGLSGWAPYAIVAIAMSLAVYRFQLPMTLRSCFYPILGHYTWGWMGDFIDGFTVFFTLAGIFTSLGVVPMSLTAGLAYLGWINGATNADHISAIEHTAIVVVTIISLVTAVAGLHVGIRWLCMLTMAISCLLMVFVFLHDDSKFLLNLQVQTVGYYLQTSLFQLNFWTDAFGQLREGSGRAVDGNAAKQDWME
jgi:choline-glycine betaine transporter